jgi:glycosyltransferase involved in cell wall biosynthesis
MKISVVIPVYNGEKTVAVLNQKIFNFFEKNQYDFEIIYVHDCGHDNSLEELERLERVNPNRVKLVKLNRNFGQHNALICGFTFSSGDFIVTMDEDLQHDPNDISKLIAEQKIRDYDVVYGVYDSLKHSSLRNFASKLIKKTLSKAIPELHNDYSAYRLIKKEIAIETSKMENSYTFLDGYLSWITKRVGSAKVSHSERLAGESSYSFKTLLEHSINIIITFSNLPIRILSFSSLSLFVLTIVYAVYIILRKMIYNDFIAGYPTLIIVLGIGFSGVLLGLGVIGEYIHRINLKTTKRPNYIVKK